MSDKADAPPAEPGRADPTVSAELSRDLSLFHITMMGLGMMIGAGVFVGIGLSMRIVGPGGLLLTFVLNGAIALFTAMSFAELSSAIPRAGGAYNFARIGFGRGASFLAGWMEWFASSLAGAFYAVVFASFTLKYLNDLLGLGLSGFREDLAIKALAMAVAGLFVYINYRGSSETGKVGALFTVGQMLFVLSIAVVGLVVAARDPSRLAHFRPFMPHGWWRLLGAMGVIYVAFEGFEVIAQAGDETIDPKRNVPKAMLYSVLIVTITYAAVAFATVVAMKRVEWLGSSTEIEGFRKAVQHLMPFGGLLVTLAVIFSSTSALNATIFSATRASYALGRDRMLPPAFAKISPKRRTPYMALVFTSCIVLVAAACLNPKDGAATASIMFLCLFFVVNLCVIRVRRNMSDELEYGYLMPLFPVFPILAIACQIALAGGIFAESRIAWAIALVWVPAGVVVYLTYSRSRVVTAEHEIRVLEEARAPERGGYRIMVAVANPANALEMVRTTYKLCEARRDVRVELLHMVPVPDQVPLEDAHAYMFEGKEGILETMLYLAPQFPISTTLRYCRNIARGIVSAVRQKRVDTLIMGWHGRPGGRVFSLGSTVDPVIERCPCNVVILKDCGGNRVFKRVLVPLAGGPNGAYALEIAGVLADAEEGRITAFTVNGGGRGFDLETFVEANLPRMDSPREQVELKAVEARSVVRAICREAPGYDLVVLGCTREPLLYQVARRSVPQAVARACGVPIVMAKAGGGLRSWIKRWI